MDEILSDDSDTHLKGQQDKNQRDVVYKGRCFGSRNELGLVSEHFCKRDKTSNAAFQDYPSNHFQLSIEVGVDYFLLNSLSMLSGFNRNIEPIRFCRCLSSQTLA